jgi:uncharacterized protein YegJ (DUF2314 family)
LYRYLQLGILFLAGILFLSSCGSSSLPAVGPTTDEEFEAAVAKAHGTLTTVRQALLSPKPSYTFIGLKIRVHGSSEFEDIWTEPIDYYNGAFTTQMVEGVTLERGFHPESFVRIPVEDVVDWMILEEDGNLIGGYTIRLAYRHMTPEEQEEFIRITGYTVESLLKED